MDRLIYGRIIAHISLFFEKPCVDRQGERNRKSEKRGSSIIMLLFSQVAYSSPLAMHFSFSFPFFSFRFLKFRSSCSLLFFICLCFTFPPLFSVMFPLYFFLCLLEMPVNFIDHKWKSEFYSICFFFKSDSLAEHL